MIQRVAQRRISMLGIIFSGVLVLLSTPAIAARHALLVGVGDYPDSALDLLGPEYDVQALEGILRDVWNFPPENIKVLLHKQATKKAVLAELRNLKQRSQPGDELFFYFSGHGTSARDETVQLPLPDMTAGLLPYDAKLNLAKHEIVASLIVGRTDLRPIFRDIDQSGRQMLVMIDSCYSGNAVRSLSLPGAKMPSRFVQLDNKVDSLFPDTDKVQSRAIAATASEEAYPYENIFFISASGDYEVAADISGPFLRKFPTIDGKPHGAFSDAMLRTLAGKNIYADSDGDNRMTHLETKQAIQNWMSGKFAQTPQHLPPAEEDRGNLASRSIFGFQALPGTILKARTEPVPTAAGQGNAQQGVSLASLLDQGQSATASTSASTQAQVSTPPVQPAAGAEPTNVIPATGGFRIALDPNLAALAPGLAQIPDAVMTDVYPDVRIIQGVGALELRNGANDLMISYPLGYEGDLVARVSQEARVKSFLERLQRNRSFDISVDVGGKQNNGPHLGGEFVSFTVQTGQNAWLVLLDIDREGGINVLFPVFAHEQRIQPASLVLETPEIEVVPPFGTDRIIALGFSEQPTALFEWLGELPDRISPRTPRFGEFFNLVNRYSAGSAIQELPFITVAAAR